MKGAKHKPRRHLTARQGTQQGHEAAGLTKNAPMMMTPAFAAGVSRFTPFHCCLLLDAGS